MTMDGPAATDPPPTRSITTPSRSIVTPPPLRPGLARPRLQGRLDRARAGGLALVVAPAGFGKTTMLAQYAHRHTGPVAWVGLAATDAAAARTTQLVALAVRNARIGAAASGAPAAVDGQPGSPHLDGVAAVRNAPPGLLLVIDNADHLLDTPDEPLLEELLAASSHGVYVLLAGRRLTALGLLRHEVAGYFEMIDADQLRFRTWEVERLLADVYGEPLPPDDIAVLTRRTGGWAAGLAMFHLATRRQPAPVRRRAVAALSDRWDLTRGYLARTVLAELSPDVRRFLVLTSVFDAVTAIRCDRLLGRTGSARLLEELTTHHALPVTSHAGAYQYHQVLRSHLLAALVDDLGEHEARHWHTRAAKLLVEEGAHPEAVRSYARAGDWNAVGGLLATLGLALTDHSEQPLADLLPGWLLAEDPWLVYAEARRRLADGQLSAALDCLRRAEQLFGDDAARVCRQDRRIATIWLPGRQPARTHWTAWLRAATQHHPAAVAGEALVLPGPEGELVRLLAEVLAGNVAEAVRSAIRPVPSGWVDATPAGLGLRLVRAALRLLRGDAADREQQALDLVQLSDEAHAAGQPWLSRMARAACGLSGDPTLATDAAAVDDECERRGDRWGATLASAVTILHDWRHGRMNHAAAAQLVARCRELDAGVLQVWAQVLVALTAAADGLPDAELEVRAAAQLAASAGVPGAHAAATATLARLYPGRRAQLLAEASRQAAAVGMPPEAVPMLAGVPETVRRAAPAVVPGGPRGRDPQVSITCFGGFRLEVDGRVVDLTGVRAKARSALRLLAMQAGQMVHREKLIDALWRGLTAAAATRNLQVTISALRGLLERATGPGRPALLVRSGNMYGLALPPGGYCDTVAFQAAAAHWRRLRGGPDRAAEVAVLREALGAYGGDLLPEEGPADWAVAAREQYNFQVSELSRALAVAQLAQGEITEAIAAAEQCLALDPFDDTAWRVLLKAYEVGGAVAKSAEARRRYAAMLAGLGLDQSTDPPSPRDAPTPHPPAGRTDRVHPGGRDVRQNGAPTGNAPTARAGQTAPAPRPRPDAPAQRRTQT